MNDIAITASTTAKLLGVIFDHELLWKEHVQQVIKKNLTYVDNQQSPVRNLGQEVRSVSR